MVLVGKYELAQSRLAFGADPNLQIILLSANREMVTIFAADVVQADSTHPRHDATVNSLHQVGTK